MHESENGPLAGLRVLDLSTMLAGPYCGRWLADLGADVIKIEMPEGDYMRSRPPMRDGHSAYFGALNAGKRSLVLDLKQPGAIAVLKSLIEVSDVLLEGFRPGVMQRFGLDFDSLHAARPSLIYCSISGYGQAGPMADKPAYAAIVHATSGFDEAWRAAQPGDAPLPTCGVQVADVVAASFATIAIQSALIARQQTGRGQRVDLSLMEGMLALMPLNIVQAQFLADARQTSYRPVAARDGWVIMTPITPKNFADLCTAMGRADLRLDPRFASSLARVEHWEALMGEIEVWASQLTAVDCLARLEAAGVPASRHSTVKDALSSPQLAQRGFFAQVHDAAGKFVVASLPFRLGDASFGDRPAVAIPSLGEHGREVLEGLLGLTPAAVERLVAEGATRLAA